MKRPITLLFGIFVSLTSFGQVEVKENSTPATELGRSQPVPLTQEKIDQIIAKIAAIDSHLAAIEGKRSAILKDAALTEKAKQSGWFDDMKKVEDELLESKSAFQERLSRGY